MSEESALRIGLILPEVLGTYGDGGNSVVLQSRARWRGVNAQVIAVNLQDNLPQDLDIYTLGGGEDIAQILAVEFLSRDGVFERVVSAGKQVLAICAAMQVLGRSFTDARGVATPGVEILDITTFPRVSRAIGELISQPNETVLPGLTQTLTGFENHGGGTVLGPEANALGKVVHGVGNGAQGVKDSDGYFCEVAQAENTRQQESAPEFLDIKKISVNAANKDFNTRVDGAVNKNGNVIGTYMHGPVLARNPQLADLLLAQAMGLENISELPEMQVRVGDNREYDRLPGLAELRRARLEVGGIDD